MRRRGGGIGRATGLALLLALPAQAAGDRGAALASMADAERAFAKASAARGIRAAFLAYLDDEAIGFGPTLGRAKDAWKARPEPANPLATALVWDPRTGDVSEDGQLGWLTGPYLRVPDGDASKTSFGCYFSIWRRSGQGPWRVFIDLGISTLVPCEFPAEFAAFPGEPAPGAAASKDALVAADRALNTKAHDAGLAAAFGPVLDDNARLHRDGHQPLVGAGAVREFLASDAGPWTFTTIDGATAGSGDLAFTYGRAEQTTPTKSAGYYVRVWRRGPGGAWRLVFDTVS